MKIHLHIGTHKTGTTSIQHFADRHAVLLREHGVFWPDPRRLDRLARQHSRLWRFLQQGKQAEVSAFLAQAMMDAETAGASILLLSGEGFSHASEEEIAQLLAPFAGYELEVAVYFRNIYGYARSAFLQHLKYRVRRPPTTVLYSAIRENLDYDALLARWRKFVPESALDVRSYEREKTELVPAFFARLGLPEAVVRPHLADESNRSIDPALQILLAALESDNSGGDFRRTRDAYFRAFGGVNMNAPLISDLVSALCEGAGDGLTDPLLADYREELLAPPRPAEHMILRDQARYFTALARFSRSMARRKRFEASALYPAWQWMKHRLRWR
jgi:hypothetical protein